MTLQASNRWWVLHDEDLVEALERVEAQVVSAAEAHAMLLEHSERDPDVDARG